MESNSSSITQTSTTNRKGDMSRTPLLTIEANRPSFLAVTTEVLQT